MKAYKKLFETVAAQLDATFEEADKLESELALSRELNRSLNKEAAEQADYIEQVQKKATDVVIELRKEIEALAENDKVNRGVIAKQASKLSDLGHGGAEDLGVAEKFLDKARQNPLRVGMKLLFTPIRTGIIKEHGRAEPQAWTTQRLFSEHCVSGYRQLKWNRGQVAKTKAKLRELGVDPDTGEAIAYIADGTNPERDSEIAANRIQFFEERVAWEKDLCDYWESYLNTAKALFLEKTGDEWQVPEWLTRERNQQPVSKERVPGKDVVAALKAGLKADVADLI